MVGLMGLCACALCRSCGQWRGVDKGNGLSSYCLCVEQKFWLERSKERTKECATLVQRTVAFSSSSHEQHYYIRFGRLW